jgi:hypothetical protein
MPDPAERTVKAVALKRKAPVPGEVAEVDLPVTVKVSEGAEVPLFSMAPWVVLHRVPRTEKEALVVEVEPIFREGERVDIRVAELGSTVMVTPAAAEAVPIMPERTRSTNPG